MKDLVAFIGHIVPHLKTSLKRNKGDNFYLNFIIILAWLRKRLCWKEIVSQPNLVRPTSRISPIMLAWDRSTVGFMF